MKIFLCCLAWFVLLDSKAAFAFIPHHKAPSIFCQLHSFFPGFSIRYRKPWQDASNIKDKGAMICCSLIEEGLVLGPPLQSKEPCFDSARQDVRKGQGNANMISAGSMEMVEMYEMEGETGQERE